MSHGPRQPSPAHRLVLVGMMASGKTSIGMALAHALNWHFWDNDAEFMRLAGRDARAVFEADGETAVHAVEAQVMRRALQQAVPMVICAPGSAVLDASLVALLQAEWVVWLRATPETLAARVASDPTPRPYIGDQPLDLIRRLLAERAAGFAAVADLTIDVDRIGVDEVTGRILTALRTAIPLV